MVAKERLDYGIDAPGHLMRFVILSVVMAVAAVLFSSAGFDIFALIAGLLCAWWTFWAVAWIVGSRFGKLRARDAIISRISWRGDERVLDVGCGHGLLLVAAAKKLTTGLAIGIDIWSQVDQWDNHPENTARNARIEGVADRVEICDGDARKLEFPDESFDVVVSSVALHNIPEKIERDQAIGEIIRVLKPGAQVAIYDINYISEYQQIFFESGMEQIRLTRQLFWYMPRVSLLTAIKPA
jgi:ubiquinone/menaquinone biosynthesis C-methylase UbiE